MNFTLILTFIDKHSDKQTTPGYLLHCSNGCFQLYDGTEANTWIYINRPPLNSPNEIQTSIALGKIDGHTNKVC
jgi:hypothetical protein